MGAAARAAFVAGPDSIGAVVAEGEPATGSSVSWAPDQGVIVASSGDLGVTIGTIVTNDADSTGAHGKVPVLHRLAPAEPGPALALRRGVGETDISTVAS